MLPAAHSVSGTGRDPFHEGVRARVQGLSWSDCPYPAGTYRRTEWLDGWDEEDALWGYCSARTGVRRSA